MPESPWLIPAEEDPSQPVSIHVLNLWLQRAKDRARIDVKGLGFHAQKRAGVRRKEFRQLPPKVQEALTGNESRDAAEGVCTTTYRWTRCGKRWGGWK